MRALPFGSLATLASLTRQSGGLSARRAHLMLAIVARYALLEPFRWSERRRVAPRAAGQRMPADPIFVLGHWRSGTTYLQQLLSRDPQLVSPTLFDSLFADVSTVTWPWLEPMLNRVARRLRLPHSLQRMPLSFDLPAEGDVALCVQLSPYAYTWGHLFPRCFDSWLERCVLEPDRATAQGWLEATDAFARKCSWAGGGNRVVLKSPGDTARLALLLERYPDARFVYIHRDPLAVFHSNRYLWRVLRREFCLQRLSDQEVDALIVRTYRALLSRYLEQRAGVPEAQLIEIHYEDLRADPEPVMRRIYRRLGLGPVPPALLNLLASPNPYPTRRYETDARLEARLREEWAFAFEAWPRPAATLPSSARGPAS